MRKTTLAKISRPNARGIVPRKRLFRLLDTKRKRPILWVTGPAGSGKTSLVASYLDARKLRCLWYQIDDRDGDVATFFYYLGLAAKKAAPRYRTPLPLFTPEYLLDLATFTKRFFENLYNRLKPPFAVVLDNYQDVQEESPLHRVVQSGLALVPEGIQVMVLSRNEPPAAFTRERANNAMSLVGWDELRFTLEESKKIILLKQKRKPAEDVLVKLCQKAEGWAAGLVLLTEGAGTNMGDWQSADDLALQEVFDYFAGEVFDKLDGQTRDFLLMSSLLPQITVPTAIKLTDRDNAGRILAALSRSHFFTKKHTTTELTYQYHSLFREFLLTRMKESLSPEELLRLQKRAAALLEESDQAEDAVLLFAEAQDWENIVRLIQSRAQSLLVQGRMQTLREWLNRVPKEVAGSHPWLPYWAAVCTLPFNPAESRTFFEGAFQLFVSRGDEAGALSAWSGAVQTFLFEFDDFSPLDRWIAWLDERPGKGAPFPSPEIEASVAAGMTGALTWRMPAHPDMQKWLDAALSLSQRSKNIEACMRAYTNSAVYYIWMGMFDECSMLISEMKKMIASQPISPLRFIILKNTEAMFYNTSATFQGQAVRSVSEGLEAARETGVHVVDPLLYTQGVISSLNEGDVPRANEFLLKLEKTLRSGSRTHSSHYCYLSACYYVHIGNMPQAVLSAKKGLDLLQETGVPVTEALVRLVLSHAELETGNGDEANRELAKAGQAISRTGSSYFEYLYYLTEAYFEYARKNERVGLESLRKAMARGRQKGFTTLMYFWRPAVMSRLCEKALEAGIEISYVQNLIRILNLVPDEQSIEIENWPWPVKIYSLGEFKIEKDGKPLIFSGRVQQKPLLLLKALLAAGGKDASEETLTDLLWPESEGDAASSAFSTTLQRLRALLGNDKALLLHERRLSLDHRFCWVDVWAFEKALASAEFGVRSEESVENPQSEINLDLFRKTLTLYKGCFLPSDAGHAWTVSRRERLRSMFLRCVVSMGAYLEKSQQWDEAVACYCRALDVDDLAENIYQRLMLCYKQTGRTAEAVSVYQRCRKVLEAVIGIAPSKETEEIYSSLRR